MKYLSIIFMSILIMACKKTKEPEKKADPNAGAYEVVISSNYLFPFVRIEKGTSVLKYINAGFLSGNIKDSIDVIYKFSAVSPDKYGIYCSADKNGTDSTKDMVNGDLLWVNMKVYLNGSLKKDTTTYDKVGGAQTCDIYYKFNIN